MKFEIKEWLKYYNKVQELGQIVKDSYPYNDEQYNLQPAKLKLSFEERKELQDQIKILTDKCGGYMNASGMRIPPPLWKYNPFDMTTWPSEPVFKYKHLLKDY